MQYALRTHGLTKTYARAAAVENVSVNVPRGSIYGFVGRNGAGKTTLMRLVSGLINKSGGSYELFGVSDSSRAIDAARRRTGAIIETPSVYPEFTAEQNLKIQCHTLGVPDLSVIGRTLEYVGLEHTGRKKAKNFSLGMRQRLGIAAALVGSPDLIILDEPTNGLDPQGIVEIRELLLRLNREQGITVFISSHILSELSKLATHYGFIERGKLVKELTAEELFAACRKCIRIKVDSTKQLSFVLEEKLGVTDYKLLSATEAEIYGEVGVGRLALALNEAGVVLLESTHRDEDLEGYFINLVGGDV